MGLSYYVLSQLCQTNPAWDAELFKALRKSLLSEAASTKAFNGDKVKVVPSVVYSKGVGDSSLRSLLLTLYVSLCQNSKSYAYTRDLVGFLLSKKQGALALLVYQLWPELVSESQSSSLKLFPSLLEYPVSPSCSQSISTQISICTHTTAIEAYKLAKAAIMYWSTQDAYQLYSNYLWPVFIASFYDSVSRKMVLKLLGVVMRKLQGENKASTVITALTTSLEEILEDKKAEGKLYTAFSKGEQQVAATSLLKANIKSSTLRTWQSNNPNNAS